MPASRVLQPIQTNPDARVQQRLADLETAVNDLRRWITPRYQVQELTPEPPKVMSQENITTASSFTWTKTAGSTAILLACGAYYSDVGLTLRWRWQIDGVTVRDNQHTTDIKNTPYSFTDFINVSGYSAGNHSLSIVTVNGGFADATAMLLEVFPQVT